jgi:hypothetical protein
MVDDWKAQITFTTAISTPGVKVHYGVYEPDALLAWPRYLLTTQEPLPEGLTSTQQHSVTIDLSRIASARHYFDVNDMEGKGGGLIAYRLEIYQSDPLPPTSNLRLFDETGSVRFYDRRFEFYDGQIVPTVVEGPFVDQITESSAIISWDTNAPADGAVRVEGVGDFYAANSNDTHFEVPLTGLTAGATYTYSVQVLSGTSAIPTRQYTFRTPAQDTTQFTFSVLGDSRGGFSGGGEYNFNGVNAHTLRSLTTSAFNRGTEFIVHTGDMINGYSTIVQDFEMQFKSFKNVVESVGHHIPIYELIGNHDASLVNAYDYGTIGFDKEGDESAEVVFANAFVNPTNGPEPDNVAANTPPGKSLPPYEENVYYFDYGNSRFVVMNNDYWGSKQSEEYGGNLEGYVLDDQTAWLTEVFSQTKSDDSIEHVFLFAHAPPFPNGSHFKDGMWYQGGDPDLNDGWNRTYVVERRDEIWRAFVGTGKAVVGNFSHEHNYSRTFITHDKDDAPFERPAWQIISGGAGAPLSTQKTGLPWSDNVAKFTTQAHYTLFKVDGSRVMLEVYSIDDQLIDSAELTKDLVHINVYLPVILCHHDG